MQTRATAKLELSGDGASGTGTNVQTLQMTGSAYVDQVLTIGTSYTALYTGSVSGIRYLYVDNRSTGSNVAIAIASTSQSFTNLRPGDAAVLPGQPAFGTYYISASVAGTEVQYVIATS